MRKLLIMAFVLALSKQAYSQTYTPIAVTGYTADVVANGPGTVISSTSHDVDGVNYNFVAQTFVNPANASPTSALPTSGLITSAVSTTPGLTYQLASYTGNNSLRISGTGSGALTFPAGVYADQVFVLATSGSGTSTTTITVTFSDNTTQVFNQVISDWYDASGFAIQGISRVNRTNDAIENSSTNPRLYQFLLPLNQANTSREIQNITFNKTNTGGVLNVMGVTVRSVAAPAAIDAGVLAVSAPTSPVMQNISVPVQATLVNQGTSALTSATLTWTVDGVAQPNVSWTGNLALNQTATVTLGNFTFPAGSPVVNICVTNPNNTTDPNAANNCSQVTLNSCNVLAGTYTIDKSAPASGANFTSISAAVAAMSSCGISAPVTFNVIASSGPYLEQVEIPAIAGASVTNTITFNGNNNTVSADPVTGNRAIFRLNGADHVTLTNFNINTTGTGTSSFGWGIHFINGADNNTISNNTITIGSLSTTESNSAGIVFSNANNSVIQSGNNGNNNLITGNTITGGYSGIVIYGQTATPNNNQVVNNTISNFYVSGVRVYQSNTVLVEGNTISRAGRPTVGTFEGITLGTNTQNTIISKNRISNSHGAATSLTGAAYGIYANSDDAPAGAENIIKNNLIYNLNNTGSAYGLYNSSSDGFYYYHNTINLDNTANTGSVRGFYQLTTANNIRVQNNILHIIGGTSGGKHAIYFGSTTSNIRSNNNNLMVTGGSSSSGVGFYSSNRVSLADWRTASGDDSISVSLDPQFTQMATGSFLPANTALDNLGLPVLPAVTDDFTNALRNPATPDMGAYEIGTFTPPTSDASVTAIINPVSGCNLTNQEVVTITISNLGTGTLTSLPVSYTVNTGTPVNETFTGSIASGATANYTFTTPLNLSTAGTYNLVATVNGANDSNPANNALAVVVTATAPAATPTIAAGGPTTFCTGGSVTLTATSTTSGATYTWFNNGTVIPNATAATYTANAAGSYTAVATANSCPSTTSAATTVTVNPTPAAPVITANGFVLTSSSSAGNQWMLNGSPITGATNATYTTAANGTYTVVSNQNGCTSIASNAIVITNTGIKEEQQLQVAVYPNPSNGIFHLNLPAGEVYELKVTDLTGKVILNRKLTGTNAFLDLKGTARGIYLLQLQSEGKTATRKLILE